MIDQLINENKVVICAGSGGVGKTTISAAIAVRSAQLGKKTLVLTVDPAKRLATALGLELGDDSIREVPQQFSEGGKLHAAVLDSKRTFDEFIKTNSTSPEIAQRILRNRLYQQLSTTLSGSQEFTSLERLLAASQSNAYDIIILDTPPTKHAIDFLTAPQRINHLFQDSITKWFMGAISTGPGFVSNLLNRGTRAVLKSLEVLTGGPFIEELIEFFASVRSLQKILRDRSKLAQDLLAHATTKFIVVTSFDEAKLEEAMFLRNQLERFHYHLDTVIINRAFPEWLPERNQAPELMGDVAYAKLLSFYEKFQKYYQDRYNLYDKFSNALPREVNLIRIPEYDQDIHGFDDLEILASKFDSLNSRQHPRNQATRQKYEE